MRHVRTLPLVVSAWAPLGRSTQAASAEDSVQKGVELVRVRFDLQPRTIWRRSRVSLALLNGENFGEPSRMGEIWLKLWEQRLPKFSLNSTLLNPYGNSAADKVNAVVV